MIKIVNPAAKRLRSTILKYSSSNVGSRKRSY